MEVDMKYLFMVIFSVMLFFSCDNFLMDDKPYQETKLVVREAPNYVPVEHPMIGE